MTIARTPARPTWLIPVGVWLLAALYIGAYLPHHFVGLDEGELGQAVDRILAGQLPHRDFGDSWTGGVAFYHALAFRVLGAGLFSFRLAMYAIVLPWLAALWALARRVASPVAASVAVLIAVLWSVPNYPAAMPSWYVLFFATFGGLAVCRFIETDRWPWLLAAGAAGGIAILAKVVGLFYLAAVMLVLIAVERDRPSVADTPSRTYSTLITIGLTLFTAAITRIALRIPSTTGGPLLQFALPVALLSAALVRDEWRSPRRAPCPVRLRTLARMALPVLVGAAVPIALFLIPYVRAHAVGAWFDGVFIAPQRRFASATVPPPGIEGIIPALAWAFLLVPVRIPRPRLVAAVVAALLALALIAVSHGGRPYAAVWDAVQQAGWCIVLAGTVALVRDRIDARQRLYLWLFLALTALCGLVRIPFAGSSYTFYYTPLAVLSVLAIVSMRSGGIGPIVPPAAAFLALFAALFVNPTRFTADGDRMPDHGTRHLAIPRAGTLVVPVLVARQYEDVVATVNAHIAPGAALYAAPDCPQIAYLTERPNPTPTFLDFLDDPATHDARALQGIASLATGGAVIYHMPAASPLVDAPIAAALRARFPDSAVVGAYTVRWRAN
jgi:hypothetical protein